MDGERFDAIVRTLGRAASRRGSLKLLAGGAIGAVAASLGAGEAAAACVNAGKQCGKGDKCCRGSTCKGGTCKCKAGLTACGKSCKTCCVDGLRNGSESDVDCGGGCARCANGKACAGPNDCRSALCDTGLCRACANSDECGSDGNGACFCGTTYDTNERVCRTQASSTGAFVCEECPRGTLCFGGPFGTRQCYKPCRAS